MARSFEPEFEEERIGKPAWPWFIATAGLVTIAIVFLLALTRPSSNDETATVSSTSEASVSTTAPTITTTPEPEPEPTPSAAPWIGTFQWTEVQSTPEGEDTVVTHRIELTELAGDGSSLVGHLRQDGFESAIDIDVNGVIIDGVMTILASDHAGRDPAPYLDREVLWRFGGDASAPSTRLGALRTLLPGLAPDGAYFAPGDGNTTAVAAPAETTTTTEATTTTETTEPPPDVSVWLGTYTWTEFAGSASTDQTLIHQLQLTNFSPLDNELTGQLSQNGLDASTDVEVAAAIDGTDLVVVAINDRSQPPVYPPGTVLFHLRGDPAGPATVLAGLLTLRDPPAGTGNYFTRS